MVLIITSFENMKSFYEEYKNNPKGLFLKYRDLIKRFDMWLLMNYDLRYSWWEKVYKKFLKELSKMGGFFPKEILEIAVKRKPKIARGMFALTLYNQFLLEYLIECCKKYETEEGEEDGWKKKKKG